MFACKKPAMENLVVQAIKRFRYTLNNQEKKYTQQYDVKSKTNKKGGKKTFNMN